MTNILRLSHIKNEEPETKAGTPNDNTIKPKTPKTSRRGSTKDQDRRGSTEIQLMSSRRGSRGSTKDQNLSRRGSTKDQSLSRRGSTKEQNSSRRGSTKDQNLNR